MSDERADDEVPPAEEVGRGHIGGLPAAEVRRIRAKAVRFAAGHHEEFMAEAKVRMYEHALKLDAMTRLADDAVNSANLAASYRKAVVDIHLAFQPTKGKK